MPVVGARIALGPLWLSSYATSVYGVGEGSAAVNRVRIVHRKSVINGKFPHSIDTGTEWYF